MTGNEPNTRDRLIAAAMELMWARSYQGVSVDDLCARAGARKGSFYHYFPSKTDLAVAAVETSWNLLRTNVFDPVFSGDAGGLAQLDALVARIDSVQADAQDGHGAYLGCPFGNLGQEMALMDDGIRNAVQTAFDGHVAYLCKALRKAEDEGTVPPGDAERRARDVFALLQGAMLMSKVANDPAVFRGVASSIRAVVTA